MFHFYTLQSVQITKMHSHTMWKLRKFRQITYLVTYLFSKTVTLTKFLPKMREREFP